MKLEMLITTRWNAGEREIVREVVEGRLFTSGEGAPATATKAVVARHGALTLVSGIPGPNGSELELTILELCRDYAEVTLTLIRDASLATMPLARMGQKSLLWRLEQAADSHLRQIAKRRRLVQRVPTSNVRAAERGSVLAAFGS